MDTFLQAVAANAVLAGLLAVAVGVVSRFMRRPEWVYWLWLLVLLKLVTPPLLRVGIPLGRSEPAHTAILAPAASEPSPGDSTVAPVEVLDAEASAAPFAPETAADDGRTIAAPQVQPDPAETSGRFAGPADTRPSPFGGGVSWRWVLLAVWATGSLFWFVLAGVRLARFGRMISRSQPVPEPLSTTARQLCARFGLRRCPELRVLEAHFPPLLWWPTRRATVVLPGDLLRQLDAAGQAALLAHELAHYRRGDHLWRWVTMLVLGLYWWHPVVWWAQRRLQQAEEQCCDAWVVWALPEEAKNYAGTLLATVEFLSLPRISLPVAVSGFGEVGHLRDRLERILACATPRRITWLSTAGLLVLAGATLPWSLRASSADDAAAKPAAVAQQAPDEQADGKATSAAPADKQTWQRISGVVRGPDGIAVVGAEVYLEAGEPDWRTANKLPFVALPVEEKARRHSEPSFRPLGNARSDAAGRFVIEPQAAPERGVPLRAIVAAKGFPLGVETWDGKTAEVEVRLPKPAAIHGRLLQTDGSPAVGATVTPIAWYWEKTPDSKAYFSCDDKRSKADKDAPPYSYCPRPVVTDADGRFTIDMMPAGCHILLEVSGPSFAQETLRIDTGLGPAQDGWWSDAKLLPADFTYTPGSPGITGGLLGAIIQGVVATSSEAMRPVEGTVTAADTGKPMPAVPVEVIPMGKHGGRSIYTRTDAAGHYRVSGKAGDHCFITAYPPPDSGYLAEAANGVRWPGTAKTLVQDFQLKRGILIPGRVVDGATNKPRAGASVEYHASPDNSRNRRSGRHDYEFRTTVLTDDEGRFKLTGLPGSGYLSVETGERTYIRTLVVEGDSFRQRLLLMGYTPIDIPADATQSQEVVVRLQPGRTVTLQALGPHGEQLPTVHAAWDGGDAVHTEVWHQGEDYPQGKVVVTGVDPKRTVRVFMIDAKQKLGAFYDITADTPEGPVEVRLQPSGTITGQVVDPNGKPAAAQVYMKMSFDPEVKQLATADSEIFTYEYYVNFTGQFGQMNRWPDGRFTIDNLLPGIPLAIVAAGNEDDERLAAKASLDPLRPGEQRNLGELKLTKER